MAASRQRLFFVFFICISGSLRILYAVFCCCCLCEWSMLSGQREPSLILDSYYKTCLDFLDIVYIKHSQIYEDLQNILAGRQLTPKKRRLVLLSLTTPISNGRPFSCQV